MERGVTKHEGLLVAAARLAAPAGALLLAVAFALWSVIEPERLRDSWAVLVPGAAGALLLAAGLLTSGRWLASSLLRRRAAVGLNVAAMVILAAAGLLLVNAISARRATAWYWTEEEVFTLSPNTLSVLRELDAAERELRIYAVLVTGRFADRVHALLEEYKRHAASVRVEAMDLHRDRNRVALLSSDPNNPVAKEGVLLRYGEHERFVPAFPDREQEGDPRPALVHEQPGGFFEGTPAVIRFQGEAVITSAIKSMMETGSAKIYFTTGHGEYSIEDFQRRGLSELAKRIRREHYEVATVNLAETGAVPDDCSVLAVVAPIRAFTEAEVEAVRDYLLHRGGKLLVMSLPRAAMGRLTGLREFLYDEFRVNIRDDLLVAELHGVGGLGEFQPLVTQWGDHPTTKHLAGSNARFPWSCPVEEVPRRAASGQPDGGRNLRISVLATSSRNAWGETATSIESLRDSRISPRAPFGPFSLALAVEHANPDGSADSRARLVVIGNAASATNHFMALDSRLEQHSVNRAFVLGAINWLAERDYDVGIGPLRLRERPLEIDRQARKAIKAISWFGLPLALVLVASLVLWRRSR